MDRKLKMISLWSVLNQVFVYSLIIQIQYASSVQDWPTEGCTIDNRQMLCSGVIPDYIPPGVWEVELLDLSSIQMETKCPFCNQSWSNIEKLKIDRPANTIYELHNQQFRGLNNLVSLTIRLPYLDRLLPPDTFAGLGKVTMLDMSDCLTLSTVNFFTALANSTILQKLSKLALRNINTFNDKANTFTNDMWHMLSRGRNITELDVSKMKINYTHSAYFYPLCKTLKVWNMSEVEMIGDAILNSTRPCTSLQTLDISDAESLEIRKWTSDTYLVNTNNTFTYESDPELIFIKELTTLYARGINPSVAGTGIYLYNYVLRLSVLHELKHLDLSKNKLKWVDCIIVSEFIRLRSLDLSDNDMDFLAPKFFQQSLTISMDTLDLSHNNLHHMEKQDTVFETLFSNITSLQVLNLSHNNLSTIPKKMFVHNKDLRILDLSSNRLTAITFEIKMFANLKYIDVSKNMIVHLDSTTISHIKSLYAVQSDDHLQINLIENPLLCSSCAQLEFLKWIVTSPIVDKLGGTYMCATKTKETRPIDQSAIKYIQEICDHDRLARTIVMSTAIPAVAVALAALLIIYVRKAKKKRRADARVEERRQLIEDDNYEFKYPIFLTYSSLDGDVVLHHLYLELQHQMRLTCRTDRELICIGDRHFRPGHWIFDEISHYLEMSALVVIVMSKNYCESDYCLAEQQLAYQFRKPILIISIEHVDEKDMHLALREHFRSRVRVKFVNNGDGLYEITPEWDTVCSAILALLP